MSQMGQIGQINEIVKWVCCPSFVADANEDQVFFPFISDAVIILLPILRKPFYERSGDCVLLSFQRKLVRSF